MSVEAMTKAKGRIFYGWWIVLASALINSFGAGAYYYGFSVFFKPMTDEFGWSRAATSGAFSLARLEGGIEGPIVGWLVDKVGPRAMVQLGVLMAGAGFISLYWVNSIVTFYIVYVILLSIGYNTGFSHPLYASVSIWFKRKRSRAIAFYALGGGLGGTIVVPAASWLISVSGWRAAAVVLGILMWAIGLPLSFVIRRQPERYGLLPDGEIPKGDLTDKGVQGGHGNPVSTEDDEDFSAKEALRTTTFWMFVVASVLRAFVLGSVVVHMVVYLESDLHVNSIMAAGVLSMMTFFSLPGRMLFGWLGDFLDKRMLLAITGLIQTAGILLFANAGIFDAWVFGVPLAIALFTVVYGLAYGAAIPLIPALRGDLFGRKAFATIGGMMSPFTMVGTVAGPVFAGFVYDTTKSYNAAFTAFAVTFAIAAIVFLFIKPPKKRAAMRATV